MRSRLACFGDRAHRAWRDHRRRCALRRYRTCPDAARAAGFDAGDPRRVRRRNGGTPARRVLRRGDHCRVRRVLARRIGSSSSSGHLCRAHADRQAPAALAAAARSRRHDVGARSGDPQQSRTFPDPLRRAARLAACGHRSHGNAGRLAAFGATARGAAHRSRRDRAPARRGRRLHRRSGAAQRYSRPSCKARRTWRAPCRVSPSVAAARATSPRSATAFLLPHNSPSGSLALPNCRAISLR